MLDDCISEIYGIEKMTGNNLSKKTRSSKLDITAELSLNFLYLIYHVLRYFHFNIFFHNFRKPITDKADILFSSHLLNWREYVHKNGKRYEYDLMIGDVIEESKKYFNVVCIDNPPIKVSTPFRPLRETKNKFSKSDDWICIEQFVAISDIFKAFSFYIKYLFGESKTDKLHQLFSIFRDAPRYDSSKFNILLNLVVSEKIISYTKPRLLFLTCEYTPFHRILTFVSRERGIPVIALQHGVITPTHSGYIFDNKMKSVLPDITCVYGQYYYNLLTKNSAYEPEQVIITGNPRYDVLYHMGKFYFKEKFLKKYKIPSNHKIILWTTQCHGLRNSENIKNFNTVFTTMQNLKDVSLIIKQHPGEGEGYTKMIKGYLNKYKINAVMTPKESDTYEQIFVSDLMIARHSTTAMEAVALNKPVIILNLSGEPDPVDYVEEGVAVGVYKEEDLKPAIEKLLKDDSDLARNRKHYIGKYLYKIDGKATERVVDLITKVIKEGGKKNER